MDHFFSFKVDYILCHIIIVDERGKSKGPVESEGFINALSSQAAKMKEKKRKVSKVSTLMHERGCIILSNERKGIIIHVLNQSLLPST